MELSLADEAATRRVGAALARTLPDIRHATVTVGLSGDLGSGKTTLARALLRELGVTGTVRSPTFTLVEPYETTAGTVRHIDLYRLDSTAGVLEGIGFRDALTEPGLVLVEWPERADVAIAVTDLRLELALEGTGRRISLEAVTASGRDWLAACRPLLEELTVSR
jgi:tRNA threonylcarbamoyladenosine biosynthesis protein TsaE